MYYKLRPQTGFVPILRKGELPKTAIPRYLGAAKWLDLRSNEDQQRAFEELLRNLYDSRKFARPPLGTKPSFLLSSSSSSAEGTLFSNLTSTYQISDFAIKWEKANRPYYIVESLSGELIAMVRHPPLEMKRVDEPLLSFLLLAGLHYGGNWLNWLRANLKNNFVIPTLLTALTVSYKSTNLWGNWPPSRKGNSDAWKQYALNIKQMIIPKNQSSRTIDNNHPQNNEVT